MNDNNSSTLKLLSWNIDGLDAEDLQERTEAVLATILSRQPDVILLQEVVEYSLNIFQTKCVGYNVFPGQHTFRYFNAMLIKSSIVDPQNSTPETLSFENSQQGRHFLTYPIRFADADIILMTSHLESCGSSSRERKNQLREILLYMRRRVNSVNVIFGGDTNLRDKEVNEVSGLPNEVIDVWESCGSPQDAKFTWDISENDNKDMNGAKPKLRFDQIFLRQTQSGKLVKPNTFTLIGKERLSCGRFASDHWGVWLEFSIE